MPDTLIHNRARPIVFGTLAYTAFTFPWAVVWHVALFRPFYETLGYFSATPNFALGFVSIASQGALLSVGAQYVVAAPGVLRGTARARALRYAALTGAFYWTCHVLAAAAKEPSLLDARYFLLETPYLAVQFGAYGLALGWIHRR